MKEISQSNGNVSKALQWMGVPFIYTHTPHADKRYGKWMDGWLDIHATPYLNESIVYL